MKITQKFVNSLSASDVGETYWDPDLKGFGLRVNRNLTRMDPAKVDALPKQVL